MERNVNFVYIGGLFLAIVILMIGFILWIGGTSFDDDEYDKYVLYSSKAISGVGVNTPIRYNGIPIGKVYSVDFKPDDMSKIELRFRIDKGIKIRSGACLSTDTQGLAGSTFLTLIQGNGEVVPSGSVLCFRQGLMGRIFENVEQSSEDVKEMLAGFKSMLDEESGRDIKELLAAVKQITLNLETTRKNIDDLSIVMMRAIEHFDSNLKRGDYNVRAILAPLILKAEGSLSEVDRFFGKANSLLERLERNPYETFFGQRESKQEAGK
ncbi:hypothetical protein BBW65_04830 [Helicobacter enhydrae]|uniref:Mce/MlaD domain-containing protein n=1 Tax=Helicobacter enhydrae TaxID=222136 RepID=A0A1B1U5U2_9HELI|nr:MlaD family protein [Helicobacter enhydrae]ANV98164.1 hypothetical protein BBW65_04830 [Helicobacter enhydrae]